MPKRDSLSEDQKDMLWSWLEMGAPEFPRDGGGPVDPILLEPKFSSIDQHILQTKCITCHSEGKTAERIPLTLENLLNSPLEMVMPGDPDESGLVITLERTDEKRMPPPKDGYSRLSDKELKVIRDWITNGAKD